MKRHLKTLLIVAIVLVVLFKVYTAFGIATAVLASVISLFCFITLLASAKVIYGVNPKFWDKVYYEQEAQSRVSKASSADSKETVSSIDHLLLCMLPNIRRLSKIDKKEYDAKEYVMKTTVSLLLLLAILYIAYSGLLMEFTAWLKQL